MGKDEDRRARQKWSRAERQVWKGGEARNRKLRKQLDRQVSGKKKSGCSLSAGLVLLFMIGGIIYGVSSFLTTL